MMVTAMNPYLTTPSRSALSLLRSVVGMLIRPPRTCSERFDLSLIQRCKNPPALLPRPTRLFDLQLLGFRRCHWIRPPRTNRRARPSGRALKYLDARRDLPREMVHPASSDVAHQQTSGPQLLFADFRLRARRRPGAMTLTPLQIARSRVCYVDARLRSQ